MERLTNKNHKELGFCAYIGAQNPFKTPLTIGELAGFLNVDYSPRKILEDILGRLAAYEDTGLEPHEIEFYKEAQDHIESMSPKRFIEIAQAEKDGRLVVLPHGRWIPFHSDIAGDIQYCSVCEIGFEEMTDFCPHCGAKMDLPEAALKMREDDDD